MRVKVKQTEWIRSVSHRHLQTSIKQSQHQSVSVLSHILDWQIEANAVIEVEIVSYDVIILIDKFAYLWFFDAKTVYWFQVALKVTAV